MVESVPNPTYTFYTEVISYMFCNDKLVIVKKDFRSSVYFLLHFFD